MKLRERPRKVVSRIVALVRQIGPLPPWPDTKPKEIIEAMRSDKKTREGKLRFVLAKKTWPCPHV